MSRLYKTLNRRNFCTTLLHKKNVISKNCSQQTDVLIVGGGAMGSSVGYWLKEKTKNKNLSVIVLEKDPSYKECSTCLSAGGIRQQFSLPENIHLSLFGAEFIKTLKKRFGPDADVGFHPNGYLLLANKQEAPKLEANHKIREKEGASHSLFTKEALKKRFPYLNVADVELACLGGDTEGWFDPWQMLNVLKNGAKNLGAEYITGEAVGFQFKNTHIDGNQHEALCGTTVKLPNGDLQEIEFCICVIAAGAESGKLGKLAKIGTGSGQLSVSIPVERRKRYIYGFNCSNTDVPGRDDPHIIDFSGAYFRRDSSCFIGGLSPPAKDEPPTENLDVDYDYFDEKVWPLLCHRVPAFNSIKVCTAWAGFYEYNTVDQNGIIGKHPYYDNLYIATGFSGHGIQQSPAVGRAIAELVVNGKFQTIDLTRFGFERIMNNTPLQEDNII